MTTTKEVAIITGATGGIGKEFVSKLNKEPLDEIWIVGRNRERLTALKEQYGEKLIPICADLTDTRELAEIQALLAEQKEKIEIPYMKKGSRIINVSSASAFQPVPFINLYAAMPRQRLLSIVIPVP